MAQYTGAAQYTRANAWNNGGTFANPDLLWYAKGVGALQARQLSDPASWWFFAAMHGEYISEPSFPGWGFLPAPPAVPTTPLPSQNDQDTYWDQCQHQSWYFPPWHRGYLLALEAQIREEVINLGGPATWALPYWNYFGPGTESDIPPAFTEQTLPDGTTPNPLFVTARYGPNGDGNIFVPIPPVNQDCLSNDIYTGSDAVTPPPGFGGPQTGFSHFGGTSGNLENQPHNLVHGFVGGDAPDGQTWGLMSDPGLAALDPIFYLHHANIDRLWAAWNATATNTNPTTSSWLDGPGSIGERAFVMPWPGGGSWPFTPQDVDSLSQLNYVYDDLTAPAPAVASAAAAQRLSRLGAASPAAKVQEGAAAVAGKNVELVGASRGRLPITGAGASTAVKLDKNVRRKVAASMTAAAAAAATAETAEPDRVFLKLEDVRGTRDASVLAVYLNVPEGAEPSDHPELLAGTVGLFGLRRATLKDGEHGGQGLNFILDVTDIFDRLHLENALDVDSLEVKIVPYRPIPEQADITVGRVSIYRQGK